MDRESDSPHARLQWLIIGDWISQAVQVAAKLRLADELRDGPRTVEELAQTLEVHPPSLYRLLRALGCVSVVDEVAPGRFALTDVGQYLRSDIPGSMRALACIHTEIEWHAWGHLYDSVRTGGSAFERVHGAPYFDFLRRNPHLGKIFDEGMAEYVSMHGIATARAYDFTGAGTIVDVGGGSGVLVREILSRSNAAKAIVFDMPEVVDRAPRPADGLQGRIHFAGGNFLEEVPSGGDIYLLASILHDWDDDRARTILQNCRRAMPADGKLLVIEMVVPEDDVPSFTKFLDLEMLVCFGGRERTEAEYRELLGASGLAVTRVLPTGSAAHIIEAVPA